MLELRCRMQTAPRDGLPCGHYIRGVHGEAGFCGLPTRFRCEEALKHYLPSLSYSSLTDYTACKMRFFYRNVQGIENHPHCLPDAMKAGAIGDSWLQQRPLSQVVVEYQPSSELLAKLQAIIRAFNDLEIQIPTEGLLGIQSKISYPIGENVVTGYVDRAYDDHIIETKLSSNPTFYTHRETISHQVGTYLLANEGWEWVDVEIIRLPLLKTGWGKYSEETSRAYEERIYQDIVSRPSHYFLGWNRESRTFGKRFWRSEFDLDEIWRIYRWVFQELEDTIRRRSWYRNTLACYVPTPCLYLPVCKTGVISEEIYRYRNKSQDERR